MSLASKWFAGVRPEDKAKHEETIRNSRYTLDILQKIVEDSLRVETTPKRSDFDNPNWAYAQADRNGAIRAYNSILALIRPSKER